MSTPTVIEQQHFKCHDADAEERQRDSTASLLSQHAGKRLPEGIMQIYSGDTRKHPMSGIA